MGGCEEGVDGVVGWGVGLGVGLGLVRDGGEELRYAARGKRLENAEITRYISARCSLVSPAMCVYLLKQLLSPPKAAWSPRRVQSNVKSHLQKLASNHLVSL